MKFYCRDNELNKMNKRYQGTQFECVVIYGRRRVGKTALINKFSEGKKCIWFSALNATANENLRALSKAIYLYLNPDSETAPEYGTFDDAFAEITRLADKERLIFVIDEYPYLAKSDLSISSKLQHLIDHQWQSSSLYLVLCGSFMSFMQNQVLGYESPLYGRRTAQFKINSLSYKETAEFNPDLSCEENAYVYGITGGIPHYINKLNIGTNVDEALIDNFFDSASYLFEEPANLLKRELREPGTYNSIIAAIADGYTKLNEIAKKVGMETSLVSKYLGILGELGIVKKETPFTEKPGKKTIYIIEDEFFRFWYRFVPRNMSMIATDKMADSYARVVKPKLHDYMGLVFEKMCREYLLKYADDLPFVVADIGQWWGTDAKTRTEVQIDIVATPIVDQDAKPREYILGSCKFRNEKIGLDELELLRKYGAAFGKGDKYFYYIFSLGGFTEGLYQEEKLGNVKLISLEKMYE